MLHRAIIIFLYGFLAAYGCMHAQFGPNRWWPLRGGLVMSWAAQDTEPGLPLVEQIPMGFVEGFSVFTAYYTPVVIVADATGVRYGDGSYVKGSKRRVAWHTDNPGGTSQHALVPDASNRNVRADTVTEPFAGALPDLWFMPGGLSPTEAVAAASFPALNRVWIVMLFNKLNDLWRLDDDSIQMHAYRISDGVLYPGVRARLWAAKQRTLRTSPSSHPSGVLLPSDAVVACLVVPCIQRLRLA